jgi:APA family basic amino acid/polyamine antiporter
MGITEAILRKKPLESVENDTKSASYKRTLGAWDLISVGVGGIIGAGIFVLTGLAAKYHAGPGVVISYLIAGFVSGLASLCYAELSSSLPVSGSAYSYTYVAMGELMAWIIGWDLLLEYLVGGATVAVAWAGHLYEIQDNINTLTGGTWTFDPKFMNAPFIWLEPGAKLPWDETTIAESGGFFLQKLALEDGTLVNAIFNVPAFLISIFMTLLLIKGIRESVNVNNVMVLIKLAVVLIVIIAGFFFIDGKNYSPYVPENTGVYGEYGLSGVLVGTTTVFFAYIGFDSVSTVAQESKNPGRDLPIGIIGSLGVCTILYILVSVVITGMVPYTEISETAALAHAFADKGLPVLSLIIAIGGVIGLASVLLNLMIGQPRIFQAMSSDGLFSPRFGKIHSQYGTPYFATLVTGTITSICAALLPIDLLGNLTSVGTLFAFFFVSVSVMVLRFTHPNLERKFKIWGPNWFGGYVIPGLSAATCAFLIFTSTWASILRVLIWLAIGIVFYFLYGMNHSKLARK